MKTKYKQKQKHKRKTKIKNAIQQTSTQNKTCNCRSQNTCPLKGSCWKTNITRVACKVHGMKSSYNVFISAVDDFFEKWNPRTAAPMEEVCGP